MRDPDSSTLWVPLTRRKDCGTNAMEKASSLHEHPPPPRKDFTSKPENDGLPRAGKNGRRYSLPQALYTGIVKRATKERRDSVPDVQAEKRSPSRLSIRFLLSQLFFRWRSPASDCVTLDPLRLRHEEGGWTPPPARFRIWLVLFFVFFLTLVTGPSRSLSLKLSDTRVYEPPTPACLPRLFQSPTKAPENGRSPTHQTETAPCMLTGACCFSLMGGASV